MERRQHKNQGQVLLIGLMLIALVTTIVGTGALRTMTSTQTTKQGEEEKKAGNIAKGALEAGINDETIDYSAFTDVNPGAYIQQNIPKTPENTFVYNNIIPKDHQYMFYTATYNTSDNTFGTDYYEGNVSVYYASESGNGACPVLEIIQIDANDQIAERTYTGPVGGSCPAEYSLNYPGAIPPGTGGSLDWDGTTTAFSHDVTVTITAGSQIKLLIVRPFFEGTKLGFLGSNLKAQGREVSSTVRTIDGAQKTETVYQAYPQIPLALFATVL